MAEFARNGSADNSLSLDQNSWILEPSGRLLDSQIRVFPGRFLVTVISRVTAKGITETSILKAKGTPPLGGLLPEEAPKKPAQESAVSPGFAEFPSPWTLPINRTTGSKQCSRSLSSEVQTEREAQGADGPTGGHTATP